MAVDRTATTVWTGGVPQGEGQVTMESSGAFGPFAVTAPSRFEDPAGNTSPEELMAAAHSSCYSMALSLTLTGNGNPPERIETSAVVTVDRQGDGFTVTKSALTTRATVPGVSAEDFAKAAQAAKEGCPVSRALAGVEITLDAALA